MSPRVAYWLSSFEPEMEAIASEVALLRSRFPGSIAWGMSHRRRVLLSWKRGFCVHPRLHMLFRAATRILEPAFQLNHIVGSVGDWFYLVGERRRPTVLTAAVLGVSVERRLLDRVDRFVAEDPGGEKLLRQLDIGADRIRVILPPVDLKRFVPAPRPPEPFTVLFASSPDSKDWLAGRGVPLLLETAALRPGMQFRLLWRPWGDSLPQVQQWLKERSLPNVELRVERVANMALQYQGVHVTAVPFLRMELCKPAPNSLVESLACGRPVLTTPGVGLAELVREGRAGAVCETEAAALAEGLDRLKAEWSGYAERARQLAEACFGAERFVSQYARLYQELLPRRER